LQYLIDVYLINGCKNDVTAFVDVSVFDISSHKYLLRAPGTNKITANSALINTQKYYASRNKKASPQLLII